MTDPAASLRATELFGGLPDDALGAVLERAEARSFAAGERIFSQGDAGDALCILEEGSIRILNAEGSALATLGPPATFGELGLMQQRRTATVEAIEPSTIRFVPRDAFHDLMRAHPALSDALYRSVVAVVERALDRLAGDDVLDAHGPHASPAG